MQVMGLLISDNKMTIRVLHIIDHLGYGGAPMCVKNIVENSNNNKYKNLVCALRTNPTPIQIKGQVISLKYGKYDIRSILAIKKLCKEYDIDILHAHLQKSIVGCLLASFFCKAAIVVHEHGAIFEKGLTFSIYRLFLRVLHHRAAVIIANSKATAEELVQKVGIKKDRMEILHNAIDFASFDLGKMPRNQVRKEFGISETDTVIGFAGRLHVMKGVDLLIEAFGMLLKRSGGYYLVLAGDGPERRRLEDLTKRLGIADRVKFLGVCANVAWIMAGFDIGVVPSRYEPFGIVALELMRMKVPIVSSGVDGLGELIHDEETGVVTRENNPQEICRGIERLMENEKLRKQIVEVAYDFSKQFGIKEYINNLQKVYTEVLNYRKIRKRNLQR